MIHGRTAARRDAGLTLIELLFTMALGVTITGMVVPMTAGALEEARAASAARYMASRIMSIRIEAVRRSASVALYFQPVGSDYEFAVFVDGNANGVRTLEIQAGIDRQITPYERMRDKFAGIGFALPSGIPDADGLFSSSEDGVRIGASRILTMTPDGSASSGTLYLAGRSRPYAVRVLGATGRTRVLSFNPGDDTWHNR